MRRAPNQRIEPFRIKDWELEHFGQSFEGTRNGAFEFPFKGVILRAISSDGLGWDHVSVSTNRMRTPTWEEMAYIKDLFWEDEEVCWEYHPAKSQYVNCHPYTLHIWRRRGFKMVVPPRSFV